MKIYWIIVDGQPRGPYTPDEIASMGVVTPTLRVWHKGLPEWVTIDQVPELAALLPDAPVATDEPGEAEAVEVEDLAAEVVIEPQPAPETPSRPSSPSISFDNLPKMPATYLPWNVLATVCCCLPVGIVGIIFSSRVTRKFNEGDLAGARRASEQAAWCLIIAIVLGLVSIPFQLLTTSL